jgi:hypothetical protein
VVAMKNDELTARWCLDRARHHALAQELPPLELGVTSKCWTGGDQANSLAITALRHGPLRSDQCPETRATLDQFALGPGLTRSVTRVGTSPRGAAGTWSTWGRSAGSGPTWRNCPAPSGGGPRPERVSVEHDPRVDYTTRPPRTER